MKKEKKYTSKEMKHYLDASAEIYNENLKGIREGSIITNRRLDTITETLAGHTKILNKHTEILSEHTKKLDSHTEMIGTLMVDMTIVKEDVSVIKSDLKKKVDYDEFLSLVKRVQKIEAKI
ncbi:hypothetical protein A3A03_00420 [Candidatus Nomurabacteria bacterium RIFCSPLOWO2_01_FULL_40_18]|uniref:Uncharacterized protein n=1 Tax=Candidatus Nomurabacteria bacterium RIFCSPLOWO2_01_FULL_40_18 TaxID=1801773 RepID=A0A1F6XHB9_9BACT|nr:MAG: hypothetical protein A3A03_00420 [Candidatus Nomurabacteria bacterium RIFCSPLOWO2_01_FULL_40_18]